MNKEKLDGETVRGNTEKSIEQKRVNLEKYVARLDEISREIVQRDSQVGLLREQQAGFDEKEYEGVPNMEIARSWMNAGSVSSRLGGIINGMPHGCR